MFTVLSLSAVVLCIVPHVLCVALADVVILDRQDQVAWRGVEVTGPQGPSPREKHTLTALSGGRLLLFGGACCPALHCTLMHCTLH